MEDPAIEISEPTLERLKLVLRYCLNPEVEFSEDANRMRELAYRKVIVNVREALSILNNLSSRG
jgi:hypothetical protein